MYIKTVRLMSYRLDNIDIASLGAVGVSSGEATALKGEFDLPKRKGETERSWGTEIEAYVEKEDIALEGRNLTLSVMIKGNTLSDFHRKIDAFKQSCIACHKISTDLGVYDVIQKDDIIITEEYGFNLATVSAKFWQETVEIPALSFIGSGGDGFLLDNYNLYKDFGIVVSERKSNQNTGKRIEVSTTQPYTQTKYRDRTTATLSCAMIGRDLSDLYLKICQLHALCIKPGLRSLFCPDNTRLSLYFKEGITVKVEHESVLTFDLKMRIV